MVSPALAEQAPSHIEGWCLQLRTILTSMSIIYGFAVKGKAFSSVIHVGVVGEGIRASSDRSPSANRRDSVHKVRIQNK
mgnify:CR=1 FL=1